ncbi:uncharacterized protein LOC144100871 isoform X1 [Amblyomma americanum]
MTASCFIVNRRYKHTVRRFIPTRTQRLQALAYLDSRATRTMNLLLPMLVTTLGTLVGTKKLFCEECWSPNQEKAKCGVEYLYEDTCRGVPYIRCKIGYCRCHCIFGFYRRQDYQCVKERECYPRKMSPEQWLKSTDDVYLKFMSGYHAKWSPFRCFKSKHSRVQTGNTYYRNVEFLQTKMGKWSSRKYPLQVHLSYAPGKKDQAYLIIKAEPKGKRPPNVRHQYVILYASDYCIIIGDEYPAEDKRTRCTYWTTYNRFDKFDGLCEYIFELYCAQPNITVSVASECWK